MNHHRYLTRVVRSAYDVSPYEWNRISTDIFTSSEWFRLCEDSLTGSYKPRHVLLYRDGKLAAILPAFILSDGRFFDFGKFLSKKHRTALDMLRIPHSRVLASFLPGKRKFSIISKENLSTGELEMLIKTFEDTATEEGILHTLILYLTGELSEIEAFLLNRDYSKSCLSKTSRFDFRGASSFDDFVRALPRDKRKIILRELKRFSDSGLKLEWSRNLVLNAENCIHLIENVSRKYGGRIIFSEDFIRELPETFGEKFLMLTAVKGRKKVAFNFCLKNKNALEGYLFGIDHEETQGTYTYFNILFYEPARKAIELGLSELRLGMSAVKTKRVRGALQEEVKIYAKCLTPLGNLLLKKAMKRKDELFRQNPA